MFNYSLCVQILNHSDDDNDEGDWENLAAGANKWREDQWMAWRPKHISMYLLPPIFVSKVSILLVQSNIRKLREKRDEGKKTTRTDLSSMLKHASTVKVYHVIHFLLFAVSGIVLS